MSETVPNDRLYWVGIGASAGGLDALQVLCQSLPNVANMIYIVAQHLSPKHESMLSQLIQRNIKLKVTKLDQLNTVAEPNTVYITPPQHDVFVDRNVVRLVPVEDDTIPKPSVNNLFVSLAEHWGDHAIGVVLSGTGSDGAHGIKVIKTNGGITIAQDAKTAAYNGMPSAAIGTGCVDLILSPAQIGQHLEKICDATPSEMRTLIDEASQTDKFSELLASVRKHCGVSFHQYKHATLERRIERRMLACGIPRFKDYVDKVGESEEEARALYKDILISVTNFFRDASVFMQLETVLRDILKKKAKLEPVRMWVVGCATGEEAYSLAILLSEAVGGPSNLAEKSFQIFATDLDNDALNVARKGIYSEASMEDVPNEFRDKYFDRRKGQYEVIKPLKDIVLFASHNIIDDPPFLRIDLISCRNLMIYFQQELQRKIYNIFHYSLSKESYLFVGKSESTTQVTELFRPVRAKEKIFQKRSVVSKPPTRFVLTDRTKINSDTITKQTVNTTTATPIPPEALVEQLGEAAALVNDNLDIEHIYGNSDSFFKIAQGKPSWNLSDVIIDTFKQDLRPIVYRVLRLKTVAEGQKRKVKIDDQVCDVKLMVYPVQISDDAEKLLLVCISKVADVDDNNTDEDSSTEVDTSSQRVKDLEDELSLSREHLQTVIEELETSNEELQSLNEELQSSNEELQSSNEEYETTTEELQSANEELVTMNDELNSKSTALEESSTLLLNIKNSLSFALVCVDKKFRVIRTNLKAREFFNIQNESDHLLEFLPEELQKGDIIPLIKNVNKSGDSKQAQLSLGNRFFWLHISAYRLADGEIGGAILSFIDNTDAVNQKHKLLESQKKAQAASVSKSEFLANVSHEIRTPLNAIHGVNEIFRNQLDNQEKRGQLLDILENSTDSLKELLDDLLDFAKLEAGQLVLEYANFSMRQLIHKVLDVYSLEASKKNIKISTKIDKTIPNEFLGDSLRIQQILANLLSNAVKFTEKGKVEIIVDGQKGPDFYNIEFSVTDTGIGMDVTEINKVFDKFTQSDASISRKYGGTGLGLSIVKELTHLMGGDVSVESDKGQGTQFTISLPLIAAGKDKESSTDEPKSAKKKKLTVQKIPGSTKILVVEDNPSNVFIVTSYLDEMDCEYDVALTGVEGLELVKQRHYPVVLLDIQMDDMNGFEFFEAFKKLAQELKRDPSRVIAVTAHVHEDIIERCEKVGMDDFLPKPLELSKLNEVLISHLS